MSRSRRPFDHQPSLPGKNELLDALRQSTAPASSLRDLFRRLGVDKRQRMGVKRMLRDLLETGEIVRVGKSGLAAGRPGGQELVTGRVQRHPHGYGFLVPDEGPQDFYLSPQNLESIFNGDRVQARVLRKRGKGRDEAVITRVLEPSRRRVMGVLRRGMSGLWVEAYDRSYAAGIDVEPPRLRQAEEGQVVGVELLQPPFDRRPARGRIVEVLGSPEEPGIDVRTVIRKYELRESFSGEISEEAERQPNPVPLEEVARREDFRELPIVTIDGETAMDFDDAVQVQRLEEGKYRLGVHIADVAHYVREGSALDREAFLRGTSVYFPGSAIPMLPPALSSDLCSLRPGLDRLTLSVLLDVGKDGAILSTRFCEGVIRSVERMTYSDVAKILEDRDPQAMSRYAPLVADFRLMEELSAILNERRRRRGTIDFDLPEPEILLDLQGGTVGIAPLKRNVAHRIIEEFMLAANEAVAGHLFRHRIPSLYRVHERPDPRRIERLNEFLESFGVRLPEPFEALSPAHFQEILDRLEGKAEFRFVSRAMLRAMKLARYSAEKGLHFGLGTSTYTHFTSPIRRYPDLLVHRILKEQLRSGRLTKERVLHLRESLPEIASAASRNERAADEAEREVVEWKKLSYLSERVGEVFGGLIVSVTPFGFFVEIVELFVEGLVHLSTLPRDRYTLVERKHLLKGEGTGVTYKIGDEVCVRLDKVQPHQERVDFSLAHGSQKAPIRSRPSRVKKRRK